MRALIQRVSFAKVEVENKIIGEIGSGLLTLLGVGPQDDEATADKLLQKILKLRIFSDTSGKMNQSLQEIEGGHLVVSQFTLYADTSQGNRPGFSGGAKPEHAQKIYTYFAEQSRKAGVLTACGQFGADMKVSLLNDGPVTLWLDTHT